MGPTGKRSLAYGLTAGVVGALVFFGFLYEAEPDPKTLLSSVDVQLRLASGMPEFDEQGKVLETRAQMIRDARVNLDRLELQLRDYAPAQEYRAFLSYLEGDYQGAADHYRDLRGMDECSEDLWDSAVFNEVRMSQLYGDLDRALKVITASRDLVQSVNTGSADLFRARVLSKLDRNAEAVTLARQVGLRGAEDPIPAMEAGQLLESWSRVDDAEAAYLAASNADPKGIYYRARLKVRVGDVDEGTRLLELAVSAAASDVRKLVARDSQDWKAVAESGRLRDLIGSEGGPVSAPGR